MTENTRATNKRAIYVMLVAMLAFLLIFLAARSLGNTAATQVHSEACALAFQEGW